MRDTPVPTEESKVLAMSSKRRLEAMLDGTFDPGFMTDSVMAEAHSPISPKRSPTTTQASSAGALIATSARISMWRS
jgi:hypothetical protein